MEYKDGEEKEDDDEDMSGSENDEEEQEDKEEEEEEKPAKKGKKDTKVGKQDDGTFKRAAKPNPFKAAIEKREAEKKAITAEREVKSLFFFSFLLFLFFSLGS